MTFWHVPILDWVLLVVLIGFGIEAYITTRPSRDENRPESRAGGLEQPVAPPDRAAAVATPQDGRKNPG